MSVAERIDIEKGNNIIVFVDFAARNLAFDNFGENDYSLFIIVFSLSDA